MFSSKPHDKEQQASGVRQVIPQWWCQRGRDYRAAASAEEWHRWFYSGTFPGPLHKSLWTCRNDREHPASESKQTEQKRPKRVQGVESPLTLSSWPVLNECERHHWRREIQPHTDEPCWSSWGRSPRLKTCGEDGQRPQETLLQFSVTLKTQEHIQGKYLHVSRHPCIFFLSLH